MIIFAHGTSIQNGYQTCISNCISEGRYIIPFIKYMEGVYRCKPKRGFDKLPK